MKVNILSFIATTLFILVLTAFLLIIYHLCKNSKPK